MKEIKIPLSWALVLVLSIILISMGFAGTVYIDNGVLNVTSGMHAKNYSGFGIVPIGTIMAWHKDLTNTPSLPDGWVECSGQTLSDADSVYDGEVIPDLNGDGRFLRGSSSSGTEQQASAVFNGQLSSSNVITTVQGASANIINSDGNLDASLKYGVIASTSTDTRTTTFGKTRPVNMAVVWIIRVK